jgi:hypothetical protein
MRSSPIEMQIQIRSDRHANGKKKIIVASGMTIDLDRTGILNCRSVPKMIAIVRRSDRKIR